MTRGLPLSVPINITSSFRWSDSQSQLPSLKAAARNAGENAESDVRDQIKETRFQEARKVRFTFNTLEMTPPAQFTAQLLRVRGPRGQLLYDTSGGSTY